MGEAKKNHSAYSLQLVEESLFALMSLPKSSYLYYFVGILPFLATFSYFLTFCVRHAHARSLLVPLALGLALSYLWMKVWQARFTFELWKQVSDEKHPWTLRHWWRSVVTHAIWSPHSLYATPMALVTVIASGYVLSVFNSFSVGLGYAENRKAAVKEAFLRSKESPMEIMLIAMYVKISFIIIWLNVMALSAFLPSLMYRLLGIDLAFTRDVYYFLRDPYYWMLGALISYLLIVPWLRAVCCVRAFRGRSKRTGQDLRVQWGKLTQGALALFVLALIMMPASSEARAASWEEEEIVSWVEEQKKEPKYLWQLPPEAYSNDELAQLSQWAWLQDFSDWVKRMNRSFTDWLDSVLRRIFESKRHHNGRSNDGWNVDSVRNLLTTIIYIVGGVAIIAIVYLLFRRARAMTTGGIAPKVPPRAPREINLEDETITAELLAYNEWFVIAEKELRNHEYRRALRAYFLGELSWLSEQKIVQLKKYKTNHQYLEDVTKNAYRADYDRAFFAESIHIYEHAWYGRANVVLDTCLRWKEKYVSAQVRANQSSTL